MNQKKWRLQASSDTLEKLAEMVKEFAYLKVCVLNDDGTIENATGIVSGWPWRLYRRRYRFETEV